MTPERWSAIEELFHQALNLPHAQREPWLEFKCQGDADMLRYVRELLDADADGANPLEKNIRRAAAGLILQYFRKGA
ncbi:MAG: hypothetical protein JNK48_07090 [Bryobacterales bacterium]|nr:hypothetical protein [Bryobacterales bacterium]